MATERRRSHDTCTVVLIAVMFFAVTSPVWAWAFGGPPILAAATAGGAGFVIVRGTSLQRIGGVIALLLVGASAVLALPGWRAEARHDRLLETLAAGVCAHPPEGSTVEACGPEHEVSNENGAGSGCTYTIRVLLTPRPDPRLYGKFGPIDGTYLRSLAHPNGLAFYQNTYPSDPDGALYVRFAGEHEGDPRCM